jgi:nicotinate-nucleotide adenylyltransferase
MRRVAVFGGSFNPPHVSHVLAVSYVLAVEEVDHVLVVPAWAHPFRKHLAPFEHRFAMCERAFADLRRVAVSDVERELGGESRTIVTLRALAQRHPDWAMRFVIGSDILGETHKWFAWDEIVALAPLIVLARVGFPAREPRAQVLPEAASRDVRAMIARGEDVSSLVPREVLAYLRAHDLYREAE